MVILQKVSEKIRDNRGSKSNKGSALFVKEQRVDGSYIGTRVAKKKPKIFNVKVYSNKFREKLFE